MASEATKPGRVTMPTREFEAAVAKLSNGELKLREVASALGVREQLAAEIRRAYITRKYGIKYGGRYEVDLGIFNKLDTAGVMSYDDAARSNTSQIVGSTGSYPISVIEIPDGLIGGQSGRPIFLQTLEKGVVETTQRGISVLAAIAKADSTGRYGVVETQIEKDGMTRSVTLSLERLSDGAKITDFIDSPEGKAFLKDGFNRGKAHTSLKEGEITHYQIGPYFTIRYVANTGAAMGMNGTTTGANVATRELVEAFKDTTGTINTMLDKLGITAPIAEFEIITQSGNMCKDKTASQINVILGRGVTMNAGVVIPEDALVKRLRVTPEQLAEMNYVKNFINVSKAGGMGNNSAVANITAAIFGPYGQDPAHIIGTSSAMDITRREKDGSFGFYVHMPVIEVGTIGGGTSRELPRALLKASGLYGLGDDTGETRLKLAEVIATFSLAYELSTLAAQAAGELTGIHEQARSAASAALKAKRD